MECKNDTAIKEFLLLGLSNRFAVNLVLFIVFLIIYFIILVANSLIILVTVMDRNLQTPMYYFLSNLSLVDICLSSSVIPRLLRDMLAVRKTIPFAECQAQMFMVLFMGQSECLILVVLAYDRYIAICYPLHYTTIISRDACIKISVGTWISGFTIPITCHVLVWNIDFCDQNIINHFYCEMPEIVSLGCSNVNIAQTMIFIASVIVIVIPLIIIIISYINILRAIFKLSSSAGREKTFSTCSSHITVVIMFYGAAGGAYMKPQSPSSPDTGKYFAISFSTITPMLNPLVYTLRNKKVQSALKMCQKLYKGYKLNLFI
ncbi:olfactory receptor 10A7-like [Gastrophryne carolinensis]